MLIYLIGKLPCVNRSGGTLGEARRRLMDGRKWRRFLQPPSIVNNRTSMGGGGHLFHPY